MLSVVAFATLAPSLLLMWYFHSRDIYPEPPRVLWATFGLGVLSVIPVLMVALPTIWLLRGVNGALSLGYLNAFFSAAIPEEFFKYLIVWLYCSRHREFNEPIDGMVYGAAASIGFATLENVIYVADGGLGLAILRGLTAVPGHAFTGAIMGYYIGRGKFDAPNRQAWMLAGYVVPMLLHGLYDFPLLTLKAISEGALVPIGWEGAIGGLGVLMAIGVLIFEWVLAVRFARRLRAMQSSAPPPEPAAATPSAHGPGVPAGVAPGAAPAGSAALAWVMLIAGALLASGGALILLLLLAAIALASNPEVEGRNLIIGACVLGVTPLLGGITLFGFGIRGLNRVGR